MTVSERLMALATGKKIRCDGWEPGSYVCLSEDGDLWDEEGEFCSSWSPIADPGHRWELYKEPVWQALWINLYRDGTCSCWGTREEADRDAMPNRVECRRIEWEVSE